MALPHPQQFGDPQELPPILGYGTNHRRNNYYQEQKELYDTVRYRTAGKQVVQEFLENLRGAVIDERTGAITHYDEAYRLVDESGIRAIKAFLESASSQITSLTNYKEEDRVNRHQIYYARELARQIILNRKLWKVRNCGFVQLGGEKIMYDSMLKAVGGFENNNISRSWVVSENIDTPQQQQPIAQKTGLFRSLFR